MRINGERQTVLFEPRAFRNIPREQSLWHESAEEIESLLAWGRQKRRLLRWVRLNADKSLTRREREYLELLFFRGMSQADVARVLGVNPSSVYRGVRRSIRKLKAAARKARFEMFSENIASSG